MQPEKSRALPGARSALTVLMLLNLLNYFDRQIVAAILPLIKDTFLGPGVQHGWFLTHVMDAVGAAIGSSDPQNAVVALLNVAFVASYMVLAPLFASLRWRRWRLIGLAALLWSLATGWCGTATSFGALLFRRTLVGVGEAGYGPVAPVMISDFFPASRRSSILAWFYAMTPLGAALGLIFAGVIGAHFGWRAAFYVPVLPGVILAAICVFRMKEPKLGGADGTVQPEAYELMSWRAALPVLFTNRSYVLCTLGMTGMMFALGGIAFWIPDYIYHTRGVHDLAAINTIFGLIIVVAGIGGTLAGGRIGDLLRDHVRGSYFTVSAVAMFVGFLCFAGMLYFPFPLAWVFNFLVCFCLFFNTGPTNAVLINVTKPSLRQKANALNILIIHAFGDVISPFVIGAIADRTGSMNTAFFFVSITVLVGGVFWQLGAHHLAADTARVTPHDSNGK